tara:strand:+ start:170 stop:580 length:411 start_codon:yes stop_codon:yes gene_type:complete
MASEAIVTFQRVIAESVVKSLAAGKKVVDAAAVDAAGGEMVKYFSESDVWDLFKEEKAHAHMLHLILRWRSTDVVPRYNAFKPNGVLSKRSVSQSKHTRTSLLAKYVARAMKKAREESELEMNACRVLSGTVEPSA